MKSLAGWLAAIASVGFAPQSDALNDAPRAKGEYLAQLQRPTERINTGVQFWIELHRNGQVIRADNRTAFKSGDKIRFHLTPNIDGYAYILLRDARRGEKEQLFPDPNKQQNNRITRGKDIILPTDGTLTFDAIPGMEKVTMLVSRNKIETKPYFQRAKDGSGPKIVMLTTGSKDLIPTDVFVSYMTPSAFVPVVTARSHANSTRGATIVHVQGLDYRKDKVEPSSVTTQAASSKKDNAHKQTPQNDVHPAKAERASAIAAHRTEAQSANQKETKAPVKSNDNYATAQSDAVTVVYKDPSGVLAADITLQHM